MLAGMTGTIFIVLALWVIYYYVSRKPVDDSKAFTLMTFSSFLFVSGLLLLLSSISIDLIARKLLGTLLFLGGAFFAFGFPDMGEYHPEDFDVVPFFIGMVLLSLGIYFMLF